MFNTNSERQQYQAMIYSSTYGATYAKMRVAGVDKEYANSQAREYANEAVRNLTYVPDFTIMSIDINVDKDGNKL